MPKKSPVADFETSLTTLEQIIAKMEQNPEQSLEKALDNFERGMTLIKTCHKQLAQAEQRVTVLTQDTPVTADDAT